MQKNNKKILILVIVIMMSLIFPVIPLFADEIEFSNIEVEVIDDKTAIIKWNTNINTFGKVNFGKSSSELLSYIIDNTGLSKYHEVEIGNLQPETKYYYQIKAYDSVKETYSFIKNFNTEEYIDDISPKITNVKIPYITGELAVIEWTTNENASSYIKYGDENNKYKKSAGSSRRVKSHRIVLKKLSRNTKYFLQIYSKDKAGNKSSVISKELKTSSKNQGNEDLVISYLRPSSENDSYISKNSIKVAFKTNHYAKATITIKRDRMKTIYRKVDYKLNHEEIFSELASLKTYTIYIDAQDIFGKKTREILTVKTKKVEAISHLQDNINITGDIGYYGKYYNLPKDTTPNIKPRNTGLVAEENGWYDDKYLSFSRVDSNINFGKNFFPVDEGLSGDPFYFSVHWMAIFNVKTSGEYEYKMSSDDDSWMFVNKELKIDLGGRHRAKEKLETLYLSAGQNYVDIYFAERNPKESCFSFTIDNKVKIYPRIDEYINNNNNIIVAGDEFSYYTEAVALYKTDRSPNIYSILNGQRHYISSPKSFNEYGYNWEDVQKISYSELLKYPRARLIKCPEKSTVYFLYQKAENKWLKIALNSPSVFISYPNNYWGNIVTINQLDIDSYPDVKLIKIADSPEVYYLENNIRYFISEQEFQKRGFNVSEIVEVNETHLNSYKKI